MASGSLWNYYRDEVNDDENENDNGNNNRINNNKTRSKSLEYKTILGKVPEYIRHRSCCSIWIFE